VVIDLHTGSMSLIFACEDKLYQLLVVLTICAQFRSR